MLTQPDKSSSVSKAQYLLSPLFSADILVYPRVAAGSGDPDVCQVDTPLSKERWRRLECVAIRKLSQNLEPVPVDYSGWSAAVVMIVPTSGTGGAAAIRA